MTQFDNTSSLYIRVIETEYKFTKNSYIYVISPLSLFIDFRETTRRM